MNKKYLTDTLSVNKKYLTDSVFPIEKKHVKGGGLLYWCSNRKKHVWKEVYYNGVPIEKKTR